MSTDSAAMAPLEKDTNIIAVELYKPGLAKLLGSIVRNDIDNIRMVRGDGIEVLMRMFAPESLDGIRIFFPDPWPKARHAKRRFVQQDTLDLVLERLRPGGRLLVATDHANYAEHVREQLAQHPRVSVVEGERPAWRPSAGFEDKGRAAGRAIHEFRVTEAG